MIITDADAKVAEIYVCKLLNIEVIESNMVLYLKTNLVTRGIKVIKITNIILPIPDEIVFGKFWKINFRKHIFYQKILLFQRT